MNDLAAADLIKQIHDAPGQYNLSNHRIIGDIAFDGLILKVPVTFSECEFKGSLTFFKLTLENDSVVIFDRCRFTTLRVQWPSWHHDGPPSREIMSLRACSLSEELEIQIEDFEGAPFTTMNGLVTILDCVFEQNWRIINGSPTTRISVVRCRASQFASGIISSSDLGGLVELERCDLDGRLVCGVHAKEKPNRPLLGIFGLSGTIIRGQVAICTASKDEIVCWLDMRDAGIAGGSVSISVWPVHLQKTRPFGNIGRGLDLAANWLWKSSWDQTSFLFDEILASMPRPYRANGRPLFEMPPQRIQDIPNVDEPQILTDLQRQAYSQYDELQQAYTQTAGADDLEDFCKYRMSVYRSLSASKNVTRRAALVCVAFFTLILFDWLADTSALIGVSITPGLWGMSLICAWFGRSQLCAIVGSLFHQIFLRHMLGHGVILRRVLISGFGVIMAFALAFVALSARTERSNSEGIFFVDNGKDYPISLDPPPHGGAACSREPLRATVLTTLGRATYYSTVTFTTLGYGDLLPRGRARILASAEALTGAFYMSMLVVVLARRHLRM